MIEVGFLVESRGILWNLVESCGILWKNRPVTIEVEFLSESAS